MSLTPSQSGNYSIKKGEIIFSEGQAAQSLNILAQGKIDVYLSILEKTDGYSETEIKSRSFKIFSTDQNLFIGAVDLFLSTPYSMSYVASEDCSLHVISMPDQEQVKALLDSKKDYASYIISSISTLANGCYSTLEKLRHLTKELSILTTNLSIYYWTLRDKIGFSPSPSSSSFFRDALLDYEKMKSKSFILPLSFSPSIIEKDYSDILETDSPYDCVVTSPRFEYYKHVSTLQSDLRKAYFGNDAFIASYHCQDASLMLCDIQADIKECLQTLSDLFKKIYSDKDTCIYSEFLTISEHESGNSNILMEVLNYIIHKIKATASLFEKEYEQKFEIDTDYLNYMQDKSKLASTQSISVNDESYSIPDELNDSVLKILSYSNIPNDRGQLFLNSIEFFRIIKDKFSSSDEVRNARKIITEIYFEIYRSVFKKAMEEKNIDRLFKMFLSYGYMDEKLLSAENILSLYRLSGQQESSCQFPIYTIDTWLAKIYRQEKGPSINEFGQDYNDTFRELLKRGSVSQKDKQQYDSNYLNKVDFEINNMFRSNNKLCHGQVSTYFPILHNEMITRDLFKSAVTPDLLSQCFDRILSVDFSAFHREVSYRNPEKGIEKEVIMKSFLPDVILMPIYGCRSIMWQEITGRNRSSPGRFILPAFTSENVYDMILRMVGNFRWELCRTMMGVAWNDITEKSLTSEYTDYIQFYKKNRELSEDTKNKLKAQIQKYHNMTRDIFTSDYETWINHESKGVLRLNKVVRSILYRYCPLPKSLRDQFENQPAFSDTALKFKNTRAKFVRELENHYNMYIKSGISLDEEFEQNLKFYKES